MTQHTQESPPGGVVVRERYKLCPHCGNFCHHAEPQEYCIICGTRLIVECPACLEPIIYPTARFCSVCGGVLVKGTNGGTAHEAAP